MTSKTTNKISAEVRARAVRMVLDHEREHPSRWAAATSVAGKIGYSNHTLIDRVKKADIETGQTSGVPSDVAERVTVLERENRELRQANEIARKTSAYFAVVDLPHILRVDRRDRHSPVGGHRGLSVTPSTATRAFSRYG